MLKIEIHPRRGAQLRVDSYGPEKMIIHEIQTAIVVKNHEDQELYKGKDTEFEKKKTLKTAALVEKSALIQPRKSRGEMGSPKDLVDSSW